MREKLAWGLALVCLLAWGLCGLLLDGDARTAGVTISLGIIFVAIPRLAGEIS
jgi:hypothetical protein